MGYPATSTKYKNVVTGYQNTNVNFNLTIKNFPDAGIRTLCSSGCDALNGDATITFTDTEINLSEFTGTIERVSSGKIKINAVKDGKTLIGTLQWQ